MIEALPTARNDACHAARLDNQHAKEATIYPDVSFSLRPVLNVAEILKYHLNRVTADPFTAPNVTVKSE